jgi:sensor c-di-GMP phosphodiesterase-like protein
VAVLVAACAIAGPIGAALYLARQQGERDEVAALSALAGELLRMAALTRSQFDGAVTALADTAAQPCSEAAISIMRRVAVASTFVQGVGHVRDGRLVCSSFGIHEPGIALGPVPAPRKSGQRDWVGVRLPFLPNVDVNVYEQNGTAVIVNPKLVLDAMGRLRGDIALGVMTLAPPKLLRARGNIPATWVRAWRADTTFAQGGQLVVVRISANREVAVLVARPLVAANQRVQALAAVLVPVGLAAGLALAGAFYFLLTRPVTTEAELRGALERGELFIE